MACQDRRNQERNDKHMNKKCVGDKDKWYPEVSDVVRFLHSSHVYRARMGYSNRTAYYFVSTYNVESSSTPDNQPELSLFGTVSGILPTYLLVRWEVHTLSLPGILEAVSVLANS